MSPYVRLLALCLLVWCCAASVAFSQPPHSWSDWSAPTYAGKEFRSKSMDGKVVVVSVWASWCPSSRKQIPLLSRLQTAHQPSQLQVLSFSLDHTVDKHEHYLDELDVSFAAIFARSGRGLDAIRLLQERAGPLEAVPTLMVFDQRGKLVHRSVGFCSLAKLEDLVTPLLQGPAADSR